MLCDYPTVHRAPTADNSLRPLRDSELRRWVTARVLSTLFTLTSVCLRHTLQFHAMRAIVDSRDRGCLRPSASAFMLCRKFARFAKTRNRPAKLG